MSNPFAVLGEDFPQKTQKKKKTKKKPVKKTSKTPVEKKKPQVGTTGKKKPKKVLFPEDDVKKTEEPKKDNVSTNVSTRNTKKSFESPLSNYERDKKKSWYDRKPGAPQKKGGKRYTQRDRSVNRTGKKYQRFASKDGKGGNYSWKGKGNRYEKKRPQEMNDEEWEKELKADEKKQREENKIASKGKKKKKHEKKGQQQQQKKPEESQPEKKEEENNKDGGPKKGKGGDKKKVRKGGKDKFKKKKKKEHQKDKNDDKVPEEEESDDEGKETYEAFMKNRKKPVTLNEGKGRKPGEGVKIQVKGEFTRTLNKGDSNYMKVSKKKKGKKNKKGGEKKKGEGEKKDTPAKTKKKTVKKLSTSDFFKGTPVVNKKRNNKKGKKNFKNQKPKGKGKPNLKDNQSFPSLS